MPTYRNDSSSESYKVLNSDDEVVVVPPGQSVETLHDPDISDLTETASTPIAVPDIEEGITFDGTVGEDVSLSNLVYFDNAEGKWMKAQADSSSSCPATAIALQTKSNAESCNMLAYGFISDDTWNWTTGGLIYLDDNTAGGMTQTAPSDAGDQVQIVGWALTADIIFFDPQLVVVEIAS